MPREFKRVIVITIIPAKDSATPVPRAGGRTGADACTRIPAVIVRIEIPEDSKRAAVIIIITIQYKGCELAGGDISLRMVTFYPWCERRGVAVLVSVNIEWSRKRGIARYAIITFQPVFRYIGKSGKGAGRNYRKVLKFNHITNLSVFCLPAVDFLSTACRLFVRHLW